jgi:hypothetical protein
LLCLFGYSNKSDDESISRSSNYGYLLLLSIWTYVLSLTAVVKYI